MRSRAGAGRSAALAVVLAVGLALAVMAGEGITLGEKAPGSAPAVFRQGTVSAEGIEISLAMHPDGSELYVTRITSGKAAIFVSRWVDGAWTALSSVSFASAYNDTSPFAAADGATLYFASKRPGRGEAMPRDVVQLWMVTRLDGSWAEPTEVALPLESVNGEASPSLTLDGTLYYAADYPSLGGYGVYCSRLVDGSWRMPEPVAVFPHDGAVYVEPHVAPDGSFLLFYSAGRPDNLAPKDMLGDLYVSFRTSGGGWTGPRNLGSPVNSAMEESSPSLSPDGKYLFFASNRSSRNHLPDIYWVGTDVLEALRPQVGG